MMLGEVYLRGENDKAIEAGEKSIQAGERVWPALSFIMELLVPGYELSGL